jgi:hypothetical protein
VSLAHRIVARRPAGLARLRPERPWPRSRVFGSCGLLAVFLLARASGAGTIHLALVTSGEVRDGRSVIRLELRNGGDEAARELLPVLHFRGETTPADPVPELAPGEAMAVEFSLAPAALPAGRWPYRITVAYSDASQYPLLAVSAGTLVVGSPPPLSVAIRGVEETRLATLGSLSVQVENLSAEPRRIRLEVHLPESVELIRPVSALELEGRDERSLRADLLNRTGRVGTRYAIFVSAEYDAAGFRQSVVVPATLEIVAERPLLERHGRTLWVAAGLLVLLWVAIAVWHRVVRGS